MEKLNWSEIMLAQALLTGPDHAIQHFLPASAGTLSHQAIARSRRRGFSV